MNIFHHTTSASGWLSFVIHGVLEINSSKKKKNKNSHLTKKSIYRNHCLKKCFLTVIFVFENNSKEKQKANSLHTVKCSPYLD